MTQDSFQATDPPVPAKMPRTDRGRRTLRALLDAAAAEFGERGFHDASISAITRRAGVALGSFYTYFDSKDAVFRALVRDMSDQVRDHVAPAVRGAADGLAAERAGLAQFIGFVRAHKEIYRGVRRPGKLPPALCDDGGADRAAAAQCGAARRGAGGRRRGPCLGDHGHERVPGPALRRVE
jgi:AcrR family transcriptional regulator